MNKVTNLLLTISSVLLGSSLSLVFSDIVSSKLPFSFFSSSIPGVHQYLIKAKTFDLVDFFLTAFLSLFLLAGNYLILNFIQKRFKNPDFSIAATFLTVSAIIVFIQTHFITYSGKQILIFVLLSEAVFLIWSWISRNNFKKIIQNLKAQNTNLLMLSFSNGLLLGFFLLLIINTLNTITILPILVWVITVFVFILMGTKVSNFPGLLVLISVLFPADLTKLLTLGVVILIVWFILFSAKKDFLIKPFFVRLLYPAAIVFLVTYNPIFNIGQFDSIEEGFLLGWLQRLLEGQVLYKDVAAYHPPLITWGMYLTSLTTGFNIYSERLFLHILEILGSITYFFFLRRLISNPWVIAVALTLFLSFTSTLVNNNIEIRIASGLLSLLVLFSYFDSKKNIYLLITGALAATAFFISIETGLAAILTILIALNIFPSVKFISLNQLNVNILFIVGLIIGALPVVGTLALQGALSGFIEQTLFYASAFSQGYFNTPIERAISLSYFHWHIFNQYLSSDAFFWEVSRSILIGCLIYLCHRWFSTKELNLSEKYLFTTVLFGLILFRAALGRSDMYHLLFVLSVAIIVLGYLLEKISNYKPLMAVLVAVAVLFFFARSVVNAAFLEAQVFKFQTYGRVMEEYKTYAFPRGEGIRIDSREFTEEVNRVVEKVRTLTTRQDKIFAYPWMPEIYFYTDRQNATSFDTPYAFFSDKYQQKMVLEIQQNNPKLIIYNEKMNFGGLIPDSLPIVNKFIRENYKKVVSHGEYQILERR